jgi:hypothetical protein
VLGKTVVINGAGYPYPAGSRGVVVADLRPQYSVLRVALDTGVEVSCNSFDAEVLTPSGEFGGECHHDYGCDSY